MRGGTKQELLEGNVFCKLIDARADNWAMERRAEKGNGGQVI